ncbi:Ig-like domain-containing protein [Fibrella arboris]|uniref:Ig-like domain-containing protein n=1 Tax=Fibrella arboris TaxID=3242486 RepID=UPI003522BBF6
MSDIKQLLRISRTIWIGGLLMAWALTGAFAQQPVPPAVSASCDYVSEPATVSLTVANIPAGYTTTYLLVDRVTGAIVQANASAPTFTNVPRGLYYAVAAHYKGLLVDATAGKLISGVYESSACLTYSAALPVRVCAAPGSCDFASAPISVTFTVASLPVGVTTTYVLVDEATNLIVQTGITTSFASVPAGDYAITAVHYSGSLTGLTPGNSLYDITTNQANCFGVSNTVRVRVCEAPLSIVITGPADGATVASLNPPISGTATPGSNVTVLGPNSQTCITVAATPSGAWTCTSLTFTNGPQSVTAIPSLSGVTGTPVVNSFTVNACSLSVVTTSLTSATVGQPYSQTIATTGGTAPLSFSVIDRNLPNLFTLDPTTGVIAGTTNSTSYGPFTIQVTDANGCTATAGLNLTVVCNVLTMTPATLPNGQVGVAYSQTFVASGGVAPYHYGRTAGTLPTSLSINLTTGVLSGTPTVAGTFSFTAYGNDDNDCDTDFSYTITISAAAAPTVAILSPADNGTATTTPTISGTATPLASVTVLAPGGQSCITTASASGTYACSSLTFAAGPQSVTAIASDAGVASTPAVSNFTVVGPASLTVAPTGPLTTTAPVVSGTATPGSLVTITDPLGATLCATTASASGTFSCSVSVPVGPNTLTVTACTTGGCSTTTTSFTISIDSDGDGVADQDDLDDDNDGILDTDENCITQQVSKTGVLAYVGIPSYGVSTNMGPPMPDFSTFGNAANLVDGLQELNFGYRQTSGAAFAGLSVIGLTFPTARVLTGIELSITFGGSFLSSDAVVAVQGRNGGNGPWADIVASLTVAGPGPSPNGSQTVKFPFPTNTTAYTEYQVVGVSGGTVIGPWVLEAYMSGPCNYDLDNDGIANTLDLDADGDGCPDVIEGGGTFKAINLVNSALPGGNSGPGYTGTSTGPVTKNLGNTVGSTGIPILAGTGQSLGQSANGAVQDPDCSSPPTVAILSPADNATQPAGVNVVSGTATAGSTVTLTASNGNSVTALASPTGTYAVTMPTAFMAGLNTVTAVAGNTGGTSSPAVSTFTVVAPPSLTVAQPVPGPLTQLVSGTATPGSPIVITGPGPATLCTTTASASGTFSCPVTLTAGVTSVTVTASGPGGTVTQGVSLTALDPPTIAILSPAHNSTATTTPAISGTATPLASVTVLAPGGQSCITTASASGTYACNSLTFAAGPQSVTATVSNPGGTATDVTTFTVVGPPSLTVAQPLIPGPLTQPISGTATPGAVIAITDPAGATLCATAASASGTFVCPVTVTTGVTPLTVTATTPGGTATQPVTLTALALPAVAIFSPADNTTQPAGVNLVSGTATAGSTVTLTASNGNSVTALASPTGTYTATMPTVFTTGVNTVTASTSNAGGTSSPAMTTFTVVAPPTVAINTPAPGTLASLNPPISGTATPGSSVTVSAPGNTPCVVTAANDGSYTCTSLTFVAGPASITAQAGSPAGVSGPVVNAFTAVAPPTIAILSPADNGTVTATPTVSGTATPLASVTVLGPNSQSCVTTASASGTYACSSLTFAAGPASVTAVATNAGGTSTPAVSSFTVTDCSSVTVAIMPTSVTVCLTSTLALTAIGPLNGTYTWTGTGLTQTTGQSVILSSPVAGSAIYAVTLSVSGCVTSASAVVTATALACPPTVAITTPANVTTTVSPVISGTATPNAVVTLTGSPGSLGGPVSVTASPTGVYSTSALTFPAGPASVTAVAVNAGGTSTPALTSFTAVGSPSLTVSSPVNVSTTTTPTIAGTATPGSTIAITGPGPLTLCTTTASASGTFACGLTTPLPEGPNTLTVTATTPGGRTSLPVTFTSVAPPTVAILSPANNSTATTTPTVSGTATPLASVTVLGPNSQWCVTTASASGTFACSSLTFAAGPQSVTAVVSTPGGRATDVTTFTAVPPAGAQFPLVTPDIANTAPGKAVSGNVLTNDTDPQGLPLTATLLSPPAVGIVTMTQTGSYTYSPPTGFTGTISFCYAASNTAGLSASTCVTINVNPDPSPLANDRPIANNDATQTTAGTSVTVVVLANDTDPDSATTLNGQLSNPTILTQPGTGTALVNANGTVSYTPPAGFTGVVNFPYQVCDKATPALCATAVVSIDVLPTPPVGTTLAPVAIDDALIAQLNTPASGTVSTNDSDPAGLPLTYTAGQPTSGTVVMSPTGSYTYAPAPGYAGPDSFTYSVCNSAGKCDVATVSVQVQLPLNLPPSVTPDVNTFIPGTPTAGNVLTNDKDPEGQSLTASVIGTPPSGFTLSPDGSYTYTSPTSQTAPVTVPIQVCDGSTPPACTTTVLTLTPVPTPTPANDAPVALSDATRTTAGVSTTVNVLGNDKDPEGQPLSNPLMVSGPTNGTASVNPDGTITYTPAGSFTGVDQVTYRVCDTGSPVLCTTAVVTFTVDPTPPVSATNLAPVAIDDQLLTTKNSPATGTVAANDSDPNAGQSLVFAKLTNPANGTVVFSPTGSYSYVPAAGFVGTDHFTYQVCDTGSPILCTPATVYITVSAPANQSPLVTPDFTDVIVGVPATGNVLTNDHDPEGSPLTASVIGSPPPGLTLSPDGSYTYTAPVGTTAPVSVPIQVCDGATPPACATTTLTLLPVPVANPATNDAPIANPDTPKTTTGVPLIVAVLANDVDPEGQPLSNPVIVTQPTHGTALVNPDGTVSYTPTAGYTGTDQLTYSVCDGGTSPACATALVTFTIDPTPPVGVSNTAPVALDDALLTQRGVSATATVAANDSDPQGQPLVFSKLSDPVSGTVVFSPTGSYTYVPGAGFVGSEQFTYQVCDNASPTLCTTATAHLTVQPAVETLSPVATSDIANTNVNVPATGNVLTNDIDPQGSPLTASVITQPTAGTVSMLSDGTYVYTPPTDFTGTTGFCYSVTNSAGLSSSACVSINVNPVPSPTANDRPIANNDNTQTTSGQSLTIAVLANDTDPDSATTLNGQLNNPTILAQPATGTALVNANGTISYTPPAGYTGVVSFPYQVCDKATTPLCATALVTVDVQPTPPVGTTLAPVALDDALLVRINTPKAGDVSTNDTDPAGLPLTYTSGQPASGTVVMSPTGAYTYTPAAGYVGPDNFLYLACNSAGKCDVATVSLLVQPAANQSPLVTPDFTDVIVGVPATGNVLTNDHDPEGSPLTASVIGSPPPGLTLSPDGSYTYTAPVGTTAPVSVPIQVCDGATPPACATTTLTLLPVPVANPATNDAPIANPDTPRTTVGVPLMVAVLANDVDPEGQPLSNPVIVTQPTHGTALVNPDGTVSYTPTAGYTGTDQLTYSVCDGGTSPACATALVTFTIDPTPPVGVSNTAPVALDDALLTQRGVSATATVAANDSDPQGQPLVFSKLSDPVSGTVVFSPTGSYTYVPGAGFVGSEQFTYQVCDNASPTLCTTATAHLTVQPATPPTVAILSPTEGGTATTTPTVSGTATPLASVTVLGPNSQSCVTTASASGTFACSSLIFPAGPQSVTAVVSTPDGTATDVNTFTVVGPASLTVAPTGPLTTTAPVISGTATPGSLVTITGPGPVTLCSTTASASGTFACPVSVSAGPTTLTVTACLSGGCSTTTTSFTAIAPPTVAILSPANNSTAATTPTISGTATPNAVVTLTGSPGSLGGPVSVTASPTGAYSTSALTFPAGPASVTAVAVNAGGTSTPALTSFTAVGPPSLTVSSPVNVSTTTTPTIAGTATPGSTIAITDPLGATLCTTTASASGTFACGLTTPLPEGPNTLTVTATTPGGRTSLPVTFTSVAPPTVAILSPADNGTATTTPTVSGTATPLASVTVLGPNSQWCVTTASASGTFACSSLTFAAGLQSVTAVVSTPGGRATDVTMFTAVGPAASLPPLVTPDIANTAPGKAVSSNVLTNDTDPQGLPLTASLISQPGAGTVTLSPTGSYTYTPPVGFTGTVSFCYAASSTAGLSASTCVSVNVAPDPVLTANNPPVANNDNTQTTAGIPVTIVVLANDTDPDSATTLNGQLSHPVILSPPAVGTALVNATGTVSYTPPAGFTGVVSFPYQVCDKATTPLCATALVTVDVQPTPPVGTTLAPVALDDALIAQVNTPKSGTVSANDSDPAGLPLTYTSGQPISGTVVMSPTGAYTYTPAAGYVGPTSFSYAVCNSAGQCDLATVSVLVQQPVDPAALVLRLKVLLQGALIGGTNNLMRDDLRSQQFLPLTEPYSAMGGVRFTHVNGGGGETMPASVTAQNVGTGDAIVDWVFVELRDPSNLSLVVATRSALVQRDGDVVLASDGVSPLSFPGMTGSFYVSVKHRNHLGVMTATSVPLSVTGTIVDFTSSSSAQTWNKVVGVFNYEGWEQTTVNGKQALWAGDANHNGKVKYQGTANDLILIFSEVIGAQTGSTNPLYNYNNALGYYFGDVNMDGKVKYQGTSNDTSLIFTNVITNYQTSTQMNSAQLYNFDWMLEQIP